MSFIIDSYKYVEAAGTSFYDTIIADSPTAYWRLGESSGTTANDEIASYNGTYQNSPTLGVSSLIPNETSDTAVTFADSSDQWVDFGDTLDVGTSDFSLMTVCDIDESGDFRIVQKRGTGSLGGDPGWCLSHLSFNGWGNSFVDTDGNNYAQFSGSAFDALLDGNPHIVHLTWSNSTEDLKGYVDGVLVETATVTGSPAGRTIDNNRKFTIACSEQGGATSQFLNGTVDDTAFWIGTVLTQTQIENQATVAGFM